MKLGVRNKAIKLASKKGYVVHECGKVISHKGTILKLQTKKVNGKEYYRFSLRMDGKNTNVLVHRLQAYQKYKGKTFKEGVVVRHRDDNSLNNSKKNILIGTLSQNSQDRYRNSKNYG